MYSAVVKLDHCKVLFFNIVFEASSYSQSRSLSLQIAVLTDFSRMCPWSEQYLDILWFFFFLNGVFILVFMNPNVYCIIEKYACNIKQCVLHESVYFLCRFLKACSERTFWVQNLCSTLSVRVDKFCFQRLLKKGFVSQLVTDFCLNVF